MPLYFEDLAVGSIERFGHYEVTREEVLDFASKYDPQAFHLDDEVAEQSIFGRLAASGWHTAAMAMRMIVDHWKAIDMDRANLGGAGMDELRWSRPVYPGDVLSCQVELLEKTRSRSRPDRGFIKSRWTILNQHGATVMSMIATGIIATRPTQDG